MDTITSSSHSYASLPHSYASSSRYRDPLFSRCFEETSELYSRIILFLSHWEEFISPFFDIFIGLFPNFRVLRGVPRYMYAVPNCVVDLAIEVHPLQVLAQYGGRQTPKLVGTGFARVETSARKG